MHPFLVNSEFFGMKIVIITGSLFTVLAVMTGVLIYLLLLPRKKQWGSHLIFLAVTGLGALAGGKLTQYIIDLVLYPDVNFLLVLLSSGSTILGGLLGGLAAALFYRLFDRKSVIGLDSYDSLGIAFLAGAGLMRIGCLWTGCCFGAVCAPGPLALTYPPDWIMHRFYDLDIPPGPRLPFPLIASISLFLLGGCLFLVKRKTRRPGLTAACFFILYGLYRFFIEFIRDEPYRLFIGPFVFAQWFALVCLATGIILYPLVLRRRPGDSVHPAVKA
jgi:phosphatidylglycerol:prolipoprotein diacylglycerol transferase